MPESPATARPDAATGALLVALALCSAVAEWTGWAPAARAAEALVVPVLALLALRAPRARLVFVAAGLALLGAAMATRGDWQALGGLALAKAAFIAAFFTALATLRNAAGSSQAIGRAGRFLAQQPPGRRYLALTAGGQLFGILLNYGSLVLLGSLAEANAKAEPNAEIRGHRMRRMLLAIQRGFVSTLTWSPIAFSMAVSTAVVPGATWAAAVGPCLVSGVILALAGWALDTIFKPRLSAPAPARAPAEGGWISLWPLVALLAILVVGVGGLHVATEVRVTGVVMVLVPLLSAAWIAAQGGRLGARAGAYVARDLPAFRSEVLLLMMAGFIGALGGQLLAPLAAASGLDLAAVPPALVLLAIVWAVPLTGQIGMNPILSVSLLAPLLPPAAAMGLEPADLIVAITAGWALSGASSPYTATTLMIGALGGVSAWHVGLRWNGLYTLVAGALLSAWVLVQAAL